MKTMGEAYCKPNRCIPTLVKPLNDAVKVPNSREDVKMSRLPTLVKRRRRSDLTDVSESIILLPIPNKEPLMKTLNVDFRVALDINASRIGLWIERFCCK